MIMWQNCRSTIWALWGKLGQQWGWVWQGRFPHQQQLSIHKSPSFSGDTYFPFFSRSRQMCRLCAYAKQYSRVHAVWKTAFTLKPYCSLPELQAGFPSWWAALLQACVGLWANLDNSRAITRTVISDPDPAWILSIVPLSLVLYTQSAAAWQALKSQFSHPNRPTSGSHCCTNGSIGEENPYYLSVWRPEVEISGRTELLHEHYWFHYYFLIHISWKLIQPGHWWPFLVGWLVGLVWFFVVLFCFVLFVFCHKRALLAPCQCGVHQNPHVLLSRITFQLVGAQHVVAPGDVPAPGQDFGFPLVPDVLLTPFLHPGEVLLDGSTALFSMSTEHIIQLVFNPLLQLDVVCNSCW